MPPPVSNTPGWVEAIKIALTRGVVEQLHTCLPGRIESYDKDTQLADVRICVKQHVNKDTGDKEFEEFPVVPGVRVEFNQSADFFMSFPLAAGDFVWLHIVEQSADAWFTNGGVGVEDPVDRHHDLSDCWAVPARDPTAPITAAENDAIVIGHKTSGPRAYFTDSIIGLGAKAPSAFVALADKVDNLISTINTWGSMHTHTGVTTGPGSSGTPATGPFPSGPASSAATKVKAV